MLVGAVTGNRWWVSLKHRIRDFASKAGGQLNLNRARKAKSVEDRFSWVVVRGLPNCRTSKRGTLSVILVSATRDS